MRTAQSYRAPWKTGRRCLPPARGFYEWQLQADSGRTKTPYYIHLADQPIFAFAGLWDVSHTDDGTQIESCTHITMPADDFVGRIHNTKRRMPVILDRKRYDAWLFGSAADAWNLLQSCPDQSMRAWPVSRRVNSPSNDDPALLTPVDGP